MYVLAMLKETEIYVNHPKREDPLPEKKQNKKNKTKEFYDENKNYFSIIFSICLMIIVDFLMYLF